jgi:hypothetical protein
MASRDSDIDGRVTSIRDDVETTGQATAITTTVERSHPPEGMVACEAPSGHIDGNCRVATVRKLRSPRAANKAAMIAALPLGRSAPPALPAESEASLDRAYVADTEAADPPGSITPAPKKVRRRSRSRNHDLVRAWNCATTDGALAPTHYPTTATSAAVTNGHGAGSGELAALIRAPWSVPPPSARCLRRDRPPRAEREPCGRTHWLR